MTAFATSAALQQQMCRDCEQMLRQRSAKTERPFCPLFTNSVDAQRRSALL